MAEKRPEDNSQKAGKASPTKKIRLDKLLLLRDLIPSRQKAQALIAAGEILVDGQMVDKAGTQVSGECQVEIKARCPYVSRGGFKLEKGLEYFDINPENMTCADIGASTGGFTDCLLQNQAAKVYAVDVGYGQLDWKLRQDSRVIVLERTNARYLSRELITDPIDLAVIDAAFISLKLLIPPLPSLFKDKVSILALIKPQFEVGKGKVGKGGVVKDPALHEEVITDIINFAESLGLSSKGVTESPILGPKGNKEFLIYLTSK
ncbi:MAG: TlyA family RNA methyltransferase [Desulfobulbaceae bacterium]|uniref:TlyA family RNA methyltransferase n=1 Tax=Candidatus Desulfobia pelagia TaxID=2841692 RepID=A0A8J6ND55_9BACT|nr:TlyA family RNA methyltransferase [Candidatus Desulfobia pelagia]